MAEKHAAVDGQMLMLEAMSTKIRAMVDLETPIGEGEQVFINANAILEWLMGQHTEAFSTSEELWKQSPVPPVPSVGDISEEFSEQDEAKNAFFENMCKI